MDNRSKILIALPVVLAIILLIVASRIPFKEEFYETERWMLRFRPVDLSIKEKEPVKITASLKSPFRFPAQKTQHVQANRALERPIDYNERNVSLIVMSEGNKMAIIDGNIVREGDSLNGMKIVKIEKDRVLLGNKKTRWVYLNE